LRVHASNFSQTGFVHQPALEELVEAAHARGLLVLNDLGSGTLLNTEAFGLGHEPTVQESVAAGADIITFSGDKLLGGPQAGVIVGRGDLLETIRRHPLIRALRVDKTTIAGVQANLLHYARGEAENTIPVWRMIGTPLEDVHARASALVAKLHAAGLQAMLAEGRSMVGGGSLPGQSLPTRLVVVKVSDADGVASRLRAGHPSVVARLQEGRLTIDLRTVLPTQEAPLLQALLAACAAEHDHS
jgi:L-seryl-tRNA(Ser) seleniumtransferase